MKSLDKEFADTMLEVDRPVLTLYNGNPFILKSAVASSVMDGGLIVPSKIKGHGFELGTSGSVKDLIRNFKLDKEGITEIIRFMV